MSNCELSCVTCVRKNLINFYLEEKKLIGSGFKKCSEVMTYLKDKVCEKALSDESLETVACITKASLCVACQCAPTIEFAEMLSDIMRFFRNVCVESRINQNKIMHHKDILKAGRDIVNILCRDQENISNQTGIALRCTLQFYGNFVAGNPDGKKIIWEDLSVTLCSFLSHSDPKIGQYSAMVVFNCLTEVSNNLSSNIFKAILNASLNRFKVVECEWALYTLETLLRHSQILEYYPELESADKFIILDIILEDLNKSSKSRETILSIEFVKQLANIFSSSVKTCVYAYSGSSETSGNPAEIMRILVVLCQALQHPTLSTILKENNVLLENTLVALHTVQSLGKNESSVFAPVYNLGLIVDPKDLENAPMFGFKKDLIRLIANLCHKCTENQDMIRKLDGIPLILDCCKLDAKNPFILQWCILTVHNLLENNLENQASLADITITGEVANSELLKELKLTATVVDGKVKLNTSQE